ncbi:MAG TPA: hypothetical protein VFE42_33355 [Chloroflexota bacterium]|nr:hypothetical protein [Chloroflexota bacterium]
MSDIKAETGAAMLTLGMSSWSLSIECEGDQREGIAMAKRLTIEEYLGALVA